MLPSGENRASRAQTINAAIFVVGDIEVLVRAGEANIAQARPAVRSGAADDLVIRQDCEHGRHAGGGVDFVNGSRSAAGDRSDLVARAVDRVAVDGGVREIRVSAVIERDAEDGAEVLAGPVLYGGGRIERRIP